MTESPSSHLWQAEEYHQNSSAQRDAAAAILQLIKLNGTERILDIGCGDGKITASLAKQVPNGSVIGLDISPQMIEFAQKTFSKDKYPNLMFILQDAQTINYHEEFDILFSSFALQWLPDLNSFFKRAYESLKSSGYLAITIPLGISLALEQSIRAIISLPEWAHYFYSFDQKLVFPKDKDIAFFLKQSQFMPTHFKVIFQEVVFASRENFEKYVIQWFPHLRAIPQYLKETFFKQIIDKYLEIEPILPQGKVSFKFPRVDIIASKTIV